jgi:serine/threonine-protein kinase RsbT
MVTDFDRILALLQRYLSPVNARVLLMRALAEQGLSPASVTQKDLRRCSAALRHGVSLFVDTKRRKAALLEIADFCGSDSLRPDACALQITQESDIGRARAEARRICDEAGASPFTMQKVATIVSELARNMVLYANGGQVEIVPMNSGPKRIVVRAIDSGPGIPNLEEILSGRYKSKTGLGRGILGTKRLADRFDISTTGAGTKIEAEIAV